MKVEQKRSQTLKRIQQQIVEAVDNGDRRVRVERLVKSCNDAMTKAIAKNDQLHSLATKAESCYSNKRTGRVVACCYDI